MARAPKTTANPSDVIGYVRVSTAEQAESGLGLAAQRAGIEAEAARRGWNLLAIHEDAGKSGKTLAGRPGMAAALDTLDAGQASALVVYKLDRATRSALDAATLMRRAESRGWALVALDLGMDMTTPAGALMAGIMANVAEWERRTISARIVDALAVKKARGERLGAPPVMPAEIVDRIRATHRDGAGWSAIARTLNDEGVPTAKGGARWYPSTVRAVALGTYEGVTA